MKIQSSKISNAIAKMSNKQCKAMISPKNDKKKCLETYIDIGKEKPKRWVSRLDQ